MQPTFKSRASCHIKQDADDEKPKDANQSLKEDTEDIRADDIEVEEANEVLEIISITDLEAEANVSGGG